MNHSFAHRENGDAPFLYGVSLTESSSFQDKEQGDISVGQSCELSRRNTSEQINIDYNSHYMNFSPGTENASKADHDSSSVIKKLLRVLPFRKRTPESGDTYNYFHKPDGYVSDKWFRKHHQATTRQIMRTLSRYEKHTHDTHTALAPPTGARLVFQLCIRNANRVLDFFISLRPIYFVIALVALLGYGLGMYYWNTSKYGFSYPKSHDLLKYTNAVHTQSARDAVHPAESQTPADLSRFSAVQTEDYTLKYGDTLLDIAVNNNISIDTLISWNKVQDARLIREGQSISIPNRDGLLHTVKDGESVAGIAQKYNITVNQILDANNLRSTVLSPGMSVFVPGAKLDSFDRGLVLGTVFLTPLQGRLTSGYGYRISPITGKRMFHNGVDIANRYGTVIKAAGGGVVTYVSKTSPSFGEIVIIRHARGFQTLYGHLSVVKVRRGQRVSRGEIIGNVGNTGLSTGPHLHFSIIRNGASVNPLNFIRL